MSLFNPGQPSLSHVLETTHGFRETVKTLVLPDLVIHSQDASREPQALYTVLEL